MAKLQKDKPIRYSQGSKGPLLNSSRQQKLLSRNSSMTSVEQNLQLSLGGMSTLCKVVKGMLLCQCFSIQRNSPTARKKKTAIDPKPRVVKLTLLLQMSH